MNRNPNQVTLWHIFSPTVVDTVVICMNYMLGEVLATALTTLSEGFHFLLSLQVNAGIVNTLK